MNKSKNAFSITEVVISAVILTIGVFGVYKLIGNNMNYISNSENLVELNSLYSPFRECLKSIGYSSLYQSYNVGDKFSINFGEDNMGCQTGSYNGVYEYTGVVLQNRKYYMYSKVVEKTSTGLKLELNIYSENVGTLFKSGVATNDKYLIIRP